MAARFCFCLPLRLGAFLISTCQLILVGLVAAANWYALESLRGRLPNQLRGIIAASALYYSLLSITALIGLFGAIARKPSLLATYAHYLAYFTGLQLVLNVSHLVLFFKQSRASLIQNCIDGSTDQEVQNICNDSFNASKWSLVVSMVVGLIIQLWAAYVVLSYAEELEKQRLWKSDLGVGPLRDMSSQKYAEVQQQDDHGANVPLTAPSHAYPYKDGNNSFGGSAA